MSTQWRVGSSGAYGLDYNVLPMVFDMHEIPEPERSQLFDDIRVLEHAAVKVMRGAK